MIHVANLNFYIWIMNYELIVSTFRFFTCESNEYQVAEDAYSSSRFPRAGSVSHSLLRPPWFGGNFAPEMFEYRWMLDISALCRLTFFFLPEHLISRCCNMVYRGVPTEMWEQKLAITLDILAHVSVLGFVSVQTFPELFWQNTAKEWIHAACIYMSSLLEVFR